MLTCICIDQPEKIKRLRDEYLQTLIAPMDGMWENAVIPHATFWAIQDQEQYAGYFCIDSANELLRFHVQAAYQERAAEIFRWVISTYRIQYAITSTIEPLYFSLCSGVQSSIMLHSYLFRDDRRVALPLVLNGSVFRKAEKREWDEIIAFYRAHTEGPGAWIEPFLHKRLDGEELYGLYDGSLLVATGECIPSQRQPPYADLGMVVARSYRGRGVGSSMLIQLKERCYEAGWKPICSCSADNYASKKAIERAGFISEQCMLKMELGCG